MWSDDALIEVHEYAGEGYSSLIRYGAWRVAILNYIDELLPERLVDMQRHDETDEVFVLLQGRCILFLGTGKNSVEHIHAVELQPSKLYNVKKGTWHTHTLRRDATVLIVENLDTGPANSPKIGLTLAQTTEIMRLAASLWPAS
jgi:hypothetical protein